MRVSVCLCVCAHAHMLWAACGGQSTAIERQLSPSTMQVLKIESKPSGLAANIFTPWIFLQAWILELPIFREAE